MLMPTIEQVASETAGKATVGKINIDDSQELALKFQISSSQRACFFLMAKRFSGWTGIRPADEYVNAIMASAEHANLHPSHCLFVDRKPQGG